VDKEGVVTAVAQAAVDQPGRMLSHLSTGLQEKRTCVLNCWPRHRRWAQRRSGRVLN
jgi:hypothetical protein